MSKKDNQNRKKCTKCEKRKDIKRDFYMSNSSKHADGRITVCKDCISKELDIENTEDLLAPSFLKKLQDILLEMNRPYLHSLWESTVEEAKERGRYVFGLYIKNVAFNFKDKDWRDSEFPDDNIKNNDRITGATNHQKIDRKKNSEEIELNTQNEKDVLRLLGYDPFEYESDGDRPNLFNKLVDYLDESTLEDGFKLSSVIEIVRTFNQIDKINAAISNAMSDLENFSRKAGSITSLVNAKDKMMKSALDIAKENGISVKHATNKSKGAGTLSGILKQLQEYDIHEADVNLFDVKTAEGIRQIADISNKSIISQLALDENDYAEMLQQNRELLQQNIERADKFEEENRKLRIEVKSLLEKLEGLNRADFKMTNN